MEVSIKSIKSPPLLIFVHPEIISCSNKFVDDRISKIFNLSIAWRRNGFPVGHMLPRLKNYYLDVKFLNKIFQIVPGDLLFNFYGTSAYECPSFSILLRECHPDFCVIGGYSLDERILSTIINGSMRSDRFFVLMDAVICEKSKEDCSRKYILYILRKISEYAEIISIDNMVNYIK